MRRERPNETMKIECFTGERLSGELPRREKYVRSVSTIRLRALLCANPGLSRLCARKTESCVQLAGSLCRGRGEDLLEHVVLLAHRELQRGDSVAEC